MDDMSESKENNTVDTNYSYEDPIDVAATPPNVPALTTPKTLARKLYEENIKINLIRNQAIERGIQICPALDKFYDLKTYPELQTKLDEFEGSAEAFFTYTKDQINSYYGNDKETLIEDINNTTDKLKIIEDVFKLGPIPVQIVYGLMLQKLYEIVDEGEFLNTIRELRPKISKSSAYNYMDAAEIVKYPGNERAYTSGIVALYKLAGLYANNAIPSKDYNGVIEKFKELVDDINPQELEDEDIYDLITNYVVSIAMDFKAYPPDKQIMKRLFNARYKITSIDVKRIRKNSLDLTTKNKIPPVKDKNYINKYFTAVIENEYDAKKAYDSLMGAVPKNKHKSSDSDDNTKIIKMSKAIAYLKQTADYYIGKSKNINKHDYIDMINLVDVLNKIIDNYKKSIEEL